MKQKMRYVSSFVAGVLYGISILLAMTLGGGFGMLFTIISIVAGFFLFVAAILFVVEFWDDAI